jgi:hypothetical protein
MVTAVVPAPMAEPTSLAIGPVTTNSARTAQEHHQDDCDKYLQRAQRDERAAFFHSVNLVGAANEGAQII